MSQLYILEAVNLFLGDSDPTASNHLELTELQLPSPSLMSQDYLGGGSALQFSAGMNALEKLQPSFKLLGMNPARLAMFGLNSPYTQVYTAYGVLREKRGGRALEARALIEARIGKITPDAFKRGELLGHDYAFQEVMQYSLTIAGEEAFFVDAWTNTWRVGGVSRFADVNSILRVPGGA